MYTEQQCWSPEGGWSGAPPQLGAAAQVVLLFGAAGLLRDPQRFLDVRGARNQKSRSVRQL